MTLACRACGASDLWSVFDLGEMPLVNGLAASRDGALAAPRYPLALHLCTRCSLVQVPFDVPKETLFNDYSYFSSFSTTMLRHAELLAAEIVEKKRLGPNSLVVEVASNDGYLLQYYARAGIPVLGIEPAKNVAEVAERERGIPTLREFFDERLAEELVRSGKRADVIHAHNVVAHVPALASFLTGLHRLLAEDGLLVIEVPHVVSMVDHCEFDTIYHEHLCYFSLTAISRLLARHGLGLAAVETVPIHGGSLRLYARRSPGAPDPSVARLLARENSWGVERLETYLTLARRASRVRARLRELVLGARAEGKRVAAYGASAKGCVLLNYAGLVGDAIEFVVDKSPHKQGRFMPGVGAPIQPVSHLAASGVDFAVLTVWNIEQEILEQEAEFQAKGGRFIVPIPEPRLTP